VTKSFLNQVISLILLQQQKQSLSLLIISIPVNAGDVISAVTVQTVTAFSGGSLNAVSLTVGGTPTGAAGLIEAYDAFTGGDSLAYNTGDDLDGTVTYSYQFPSADFIDIVVTPTGDGLKDATAGEVRILLDIKRI
jgi:hypothetical protein